MKVRCIKLLDGRGEPTDYSPWVKIGAIYHVLSVWVDERGVQFRLFGETGEVKHTPALFGLEMFEIVSPIIPPSWVMTSPAPGCLSLEPEIWTHEFWVRYFDADPDARACFERERIKILAADP